MSETSKPNDRPRVVLDAKGRRWIERSFEGELYWEPDGWDLRLDDTGASELAAALAVAAEEWRGAQREAWRLDMVADALMRAYAENAELREALERIARAQRWSVNVDGRSLITTTDGQYLDAAEVMTIIIAARKRQGGRDG